MNRDAGYGDATVAVSDGLALRSWTLKLSGWLVGWLVGWLDGWMVGWLVGWLVG